MAEMHNILDTIKILANSNWTECPISNSAFPLGRVQQCFINPVCDKPILMIENTKLDLLSQHEIQHVILPYMAGDTMSLHFNNEVISKGENGPESPFITNPNGIISYHSLFGQRIIMLTKGNYDFVLFMNLRDLTRLKLLMNTGNLTEGVEMTQQMMKYDGRDTLNQVDLDVVYTTFEETSELAKFENYLRDHAIVYKILLEEGPAGGNPLVRFYGRSGELCEMIKDLWCTSGEKVDHDQLNHLCSLIEKVTQ